MDELSESLMKLSLSLKTEVMRGIQDDKLRKVHYYSYDVVKYGYDNFNGITNCEWKRSSIYKYDWHASALYLIDKIKDFNKYKDTLEQLSIFIRNNNVSHNPEFSLNHFIEKLVQSILSEIEIHEDLDSHLSHLEFDKDDIDKLIKIFLNELLGTPTKCRMTIELSGIVLRINKIKLDDNAELRRPNKNDLKKLFLVDSFEEKKTTLPSAIVIIELEEDENSLISKRRVIEHVIALLSLFKVGNVKCLYYNFESDSIMNHHVSNILDMHRSKISSVNLWEGLFQKKYILSVHLVRHLKQFIRVIDNYIYKLFSKGSHSHLNVAYGHYRNALATYNHREDYFVEKRITETIIGLEALYLTEVQELSYRIKMRISKLFDILLTNEHKSIRKKLEESYDPEKVRERIEDGYKIRNKFAHGDRPTHDNIMKLNRKYGDLDKLLTYLLDYLRISIILTLFNDKKQVIKAVEGALIKSENEEKLRDIFSKTKEIILLNNADLSTKEIISYYSERLNEY